MPFLLIPKFLPVLPCTGLFRHSWTVSPQAPQPQGFWDFKDDINDKTLGGTHHQQELVGGSVGRFQLFNSNTPNLHPGHAASRDIQQRQTNKIQPTKPSSHPHSSHVSLNILSCMSPCQFQQQIQAESDHQCWTTSVTRSSLPLRLPIFAASAGVWFEFYIYRRPSLGWNFRWNCSIWDRPCDDWPSNVKCWWIQLHKKGKLCIIFYPLFEYFSNFLPSKKAPTLWQPIEWF